MLCSPAGFPGLHDLRQSRRFIFCPSPHIGEDEGVFHLCPHGDLKPRHKRESGPRERNTTALNVKAICYLFPHAEPLALRQLPETHRKKGRGEQSTGGET